VNSDKTDTISADGRPLPVRCPCPLPPDRFHLGSHTSPVEGLGFGVLIALFLLVAPRGKSSHVVGPANLAHRGPRVRTGTDLRRTWRCPIRSIWRTWCPVERNGRRCLLWGVVTGKSRWVCGVSRCCRPRSRPLAAEGPRGDPRATRSFVAAGVLLGWVC